VHSTTCSGVLDVFDTLKEHILQKTVPRVALSEELLTDIDRVFKLERKQDNSNKK